MSLSQIKFIPPHFHLPQDISKEIHIFFGGENKRIRCWPAAVLTSVFTKSVWIKERALILAQEQVCTKGQSIPKVPWPRLTHTRTHTHSYTCVPMLPSLWLYMQSACILLGCILKSSAANLGFKLTEGLINGMLKWVTSSKWIQDQLEGFVRDRRCRAITCVFSPSSFLLFFFPFVFFFFFFFYEAGIYDASFVNHSSQPWAGL